MRFFDKYRNATKFALLFALILMVMGAMITFAEGAGTSYSLTVVKKLEGSGADENDEFKFRVTLTQSDECGLTWCHTFNAKKISSGFQVEETYPDIPENGVIEFTIKGSGSWSHAFICAFDYTVEEIDANGYTLSSSSGTSGAAGVGATAYFTNTKDGPPPTGSYKIRHEYYHIPWDSEYSIYDAPFDVWIDDNIDKNLTSAKDLPIDDGTHYTSADVEKLAGEYTYRGDQDAYEPSSKEYVVATEDGSETIILRYLRKEQTPPAYYNIVHVYYRDDTLMDYVGETTVEQKEGTMNQPYYADPSLYKTNYGGKTYVHNSDVYGTVSGGVWTVDSRIGATATEAGNEIIIMRYHLTGGYNVRHEYYHIDAESQLDASSPFDPEEWTLDGVDDYSDSPVTGLRLDTTQYSAAGRERTNYLGHEYTARPDLYDHETATGKTGPDGYVLATEGNDDTIVLRYVYKHNLNEGFYKIRHEYYLVDSDGNIIREEGTEDGGQSQPVRLPNDNQYTFAQVTPIPKHTSTFDNVEYPYEFQAEESYHEKADGSRGAYVEDTPNGDETIVMVYYRYLGEGFYRVVHEYYENEVDPANLVGRTEIEDSKTVKLPSSETYTANSSMWKEEYKGAAYTHVEDAYGKMTGGGSYTADDSMKSVAATEKGEQVIILRYVRSTEVGSYNVIHEYYLESDGALVPEGTEGPFKVEGLSLDGTRYTADGVELITQHVYGGVSRTYAHDNDAYGRMEGGSYTPDGGMNYVTATKNGEEIIILRYVRSDVTPPPELPDPNDPDSPDEITIEEDGVPKTYIKVWDPEEEEWIYVPEDDVPLADADAPRTGDESRIAVWATLALVSLGGLMVLAQVKRRENGK